MVTKNVAAKVLSKESLDDGWHIQFEAEGISDWLHVYKIPTNDAEHMAKGKTVFASLRRGALKPDKDPEKLWSYRWEWEGFANPDDAVAGTPAPHEDEPHPADAYAAERPNEVGIEAPQPQDGTQGQEEAEQGLVVRHYRYSRTFNLGGFESLKLEMEGDAIPGWSDLAMFTLLGERIDAVRAQLPTDTSARQAAREQQNES